MYMFEEEALIYIATASVLQWWWAAYAFVTLEKLVQYDWVTVYQTPVYNHRIRL